MKKLVIYYSLNGSTKYIAEKICKELNADILELKPVKSMNPKGFMKFVWGGKQVLFHEQPKLEPIKEDIQSYDFVVFGTPVWAGSYVPAFNTFFRDNKLVHKRIALFCCHDGSKGKVFDNFKNSLQTSNVVSEIDFKYPAKDIEAQASNACKWIKELSVRLGIL
jgi:flavodoxin